MSDEYQSIPVAAARAAVQESGLLEGVEGPLFMAEAGQPWEPFFSKVLYGADGHPEFAKVTVTRKGQKPREVVIAWDEYAEQMDDPEWDAIRESKPMSVFGGEAERHAYRAVFADVLAAVFPPRIAVGAAPAKGWEPRNDRMMIVPDAEAAVRDWIADVKRAASGEALNSLYDDAKAAGALAKVDGLQAAFMERMLDLEHPKPKPPSEPRPQGQPRRRRGKSRT